METQGLVKPTEHAKSRTTFKGYVSHTEESFEAENLEYLCAEIKHHMRINLEGIVNAKDWEDIPVGYHGNVYFLVYYWMVKLKENDLGNDYDYVLRGERSGILGFKKEKEDFVASCNAEEKKHWYDDVLTNEEHLTPGYLEIRKVLYD